MPPCYDDVRWRILNKPLKISIRQLALLEHMIAESRDPLQGCTLMTVGRPRDNSGNDGLVDVNRPIQRTTEYHDLKYCDADDFGTFIT